MVATWNRNTPWRQGHVLPVQALEELGLVHPDSSQAICVVVVSHDCDLANEDLQKEPNVEIVIGCHPERSDGNYFWAKTPRTLHMHAQRGGSPVVIELVATAKGQVSKASLAAFEPDADYCLTGKSIAALRSWLSFRYNRAAFPDQFVNRLSQSKVDKALAKLIEPTGQLLSAVYFYVDGGSEVDRTDGSPYELEIFLVYPPADYPEQRADEAEKLEAAIEELFSKKYFDVARGEWTGVAIKACKAISEDDLTVTKSKQLTQWRLEHMTLKAEDS